MKSFQITKHTFVATPDKQDLKKGIIGFQIISYSLEYCGLNISGETDTIVMKDGRQFVHGGDGWMKHGTEIAN
jgi:hypothetical protein